MYILKGDPKKTESAATSFAKNITDGINLLTMTTDMEFDIKEWQATNYPNLLEYMETIEKNIKDNLPELALADVKQASNTSGYALSLMLYDLIAKIEEVR